MKSLGTVRLRNQSIARNSQRMSYTFEGSALLEYTHSVEQHVRRLEVPVQDGSRVYVLERAQDLVEEVLRVLVGESLPRVDHAVEVRLHQLGDDVHVLFSTVSGRERTRTTAAEQQQQQQQNG